MSGGRRQRVLPRLGHVILIASPGILILAEDYFLMRIITDQDKSRALKNVLVPPPHFWASGQCPASALWSAPGQRTQWCHRDTSPAFVTLSRSGGLRNVTKQVMMGGCSLQMTGVGNPESGRDCNCNEASSWPLTVWAASWHHPSVSWCFSKLCYEQSHIPMIYLLFVPIILEFKRWG